MRILESVETYAVITLELKHESDEMNSLQDLLIAMGCAQHIDAKVVPAIHNNISLHLHPDDYIKTFHIFYTYIPIHIHYIKFPLSSLHYYSLYL